MKVAALLFTFLLYASPSVAEVTEDVRCHEIAFSRSVENRDASAFRALIDADARFIGGSVQRGIADVVGAWKIFFEADGPRIKWRPQYVEVLEDETLALSRGPYRLTFIGEYGDTVERWGTFNSVWRKQPDGTWKIIFDAGNEADEAPPAEVQALLEQESDCP